MNYTELRTALNAYMHRSDAETVGNEPTALSLSLAYLARMFFPSECYTVTAVLVPVAGALALPSDYGRMDVVATAGRPGQLGYAAPREWAELVAAGGLARLGLYTIAGAQLLVDPSVTGVVLNYYARAQPISGTAANFISTNYPDVWLEAAIAEQWRFLQDFDSAQGAADRCVRLAGTAESQSIINNQAGGALRMKGR